VTWVPLLVASTVHAQASAPPRAAEQPTIAAGPASSETAEPSEPLPITLRPEPALRRLAQRVAHTLHRRTADVIALGGPPPPDLLEAVPSRHVAIARDADDNERIRVVFGGDEGVSYATDVFLPSLSGDAAVRAIALAIEALIDAARDGPPPEQDDGGSPWVTRYTLISPIPRPRPTEAIAKPTIYLRLLLGYSPTRERMLIGPGVGLGLCVGPHCVVLEGDLPLLPDEATAVDGAVISYRPVNVSVRGQFRPNWSNTWIPGASIGFVTRIGNASIVGTDVSQTVSNLGIRATLELAWRFLPRFEWVIEAGVDAAISRAQFIRYGEVVALEDFWTPWFVSSLRLRP
jgi:hypothetical protein